VTKKKVLKIVVGQVYIDGKSYNVTQDAWEQTSKKGETFYEIRSPVFVNQVEVKDKDEGTKEESVSA